MVLNRTCPICEVEYKASSTRLKHGRQITCSKSCSYEYRARKRRNGFDKKAYADKYNKEYYQQYKERIKSHVYEYKRVTGYKYILNNEQRSRSNEKARQWYREHKQVVIDRSKVWKKANKDKVNAGSRAYASRRRGAVGRYSVKDYMRLKLLYSGMCAYCNERPANSIDHVTPLSKGGSNTIGNILPVCTYCNSSKGSKNLYTWKVANERLLTV